MARLGPQSEDMGRKRAGGGSSPGVVFYWGQGWGARVLQVYSLLVIQT